MSVEKKTKFTDEMIETLREKYDSVQTIDPCLDGYKEICKLLERMDVAQLTQLVQAKIKWISSLARNRLPRDIRYTV